MSEFVGRTGSQRLYSYPEAPRGGSYSALFARNFAYGPLFPTPVDIDTSPGTDVPWSVIESGALAGVIVPITPRSSGVVRISGVIVVKSSSESAESVSLQILGNGDILLGVPFLETQSIIANGFAAIPFASEAYPLPVGVVVNIKIRLTASTGGGVLQLRPDSSTIDLQEVPVATG